MKKKLLLILFILVIILGGVFYYFNSKLVYNDVDTIGNTAGNLLNGGLFCEYDKKIYFSNQLDEGTLYVMNDDCSNVKKIYDDVASHINVAGKYIYYARKNNHREKTTGNVFEFKNVGIYRMEKNGSNITRLYDRDTEFVSLIGNEVYYQPYKTKGGVQLEKVKINGKKAENISEYPITPASFQNGSMYYTEIEYNHNLSKMDLITGSTSTIYEGNCTNSIAQDDYIYFMDMDHNYGIARVQLDGSNPELIIKERCSTYNLDPNGRYIYYQVDDGENNRICKYNMETGQAETIREGNFNSIHVTSNYVFFQELEKNTTYILSKGPNETLGTFLPPTE